jgi:hypothetical protein
MGARLDEWIRMGVTNVTTFVPWQAVESDISHTLTRFLQAAAERKLTVSLILTPEVGVHFANSGLPKDLFSKPENTARHTHGGAVPVALPPNAFPLPSLAAPEFTKRYHNFLSRIDSLLADLGRAQPQLLEKVTVVLTGSYFKYYRAPHDSAPGAFGGSAGDQSGCAAVAYRQRLEQFYAQREFTDPTPAAAARWKTRALEEVNRRWFAQHSEDVFRSRSTQFIRRKATSVKLRPIELYTPEADPAFSYSNFVQLVTGANGNFPRLSSLVDEAATRAAAAGEGSEAAPFVHFTGLGSFRTLSDSEKQFLILKSLLLMGGRGGGILVDESEWFALSRSFRTRAEALARSLAQAELRIRTRALYLAPHLWSGAGTLWDELRSRAGHGARLVSSVDLVTRDRSAEIAFVDPSYILTRDALARLAGWARGGRVLVLPRTPLYTEAARAELAEALEAGGQALEISLGVPYRLHRLGEGRLVLFDVPEGASMRGEALASWQTFLASALSVAGVQAPCSLSDARLDAIPLDRREGGAGLFILNGTSRPVAADLLFPTEVCVSDLATSFAMGPREPQAAAAGGPAPVVPANRFALEVPPCGILPISVDGLDRDFEERRAALLTSEVLKTHAETAAANELAGLGSGGADLEATWS